MSSDTGSSQTGYSNYGVNTSTGVQMQSLGFTLGVGLACLFGILMLFGLAIYFRLTNIAHRCEARPRQVIYAGKDCHPSQDRGNPFLLGWAFWAMNRTYDELINGVAGTGTRHGGLTGSMLKVNLDHIIFLRFNALGLKISVVAMLVYITINLPVYFYAQCSHIPLGALQEDNYTCVNSQNYTLTSYSRFTLANIPDVEVNVDKVAVVNEDGINYDFFNFSMYAVALSSWLVVWFVCFELFNEWVDILAMRRVYYLEWDIWKERKQELKTTMMKQMRDHKDTSNSNLSHRESWIPHPEQRDTPANIELYSVLVGGIPSKPNDVVDEQDLEAAMESNCSSDIDWQLSVTSAFFDACVPNQPGFTSSVAAVTILPSAADLWQAWKQWQALSKRLSRLRFIRRRIRELGYEPNGQTLVEAHHQEGHQGDNNHISLGKDTDNDDDDVSEEQEDENTIGSTTSVFARSYSVLQQQSSEGEGVRQADLFKAYRAEVLGAGSDKINDAFWKSLDLGPEQVGVYNMEMAKSVAGPCPYGFCQQRISYCSDIEELWEMEADAAEQATEAYLELKETGNTAAVARGKRPEGFTLMHHLVETTGIAKESVLKESTKPTTESQLMRRKQNMRSEGAESYKSLGNLMASSNQNVNTSAVASEAHPLQSINESIGVTKGSGSYENFELTDASAVYQAQDRPENMESAELTGAGADSKKQDCSANVEATVDPAIVAMEAQQLQPENIESNSVPLIDRSSQGSHDWFNTISNTETSDTLEFEGVEQARTPTEISNAQADDHLEIGLTQDDNADGTDTAGCDVEALNDVTVESLSDNGNILLDGRNGASQRRNFATEFASTGLASTVKFAKGAGKKVTALPGSAVKGMESAAKLGVSAANNLVAKSAGTANAAKDVATSATGLATGLLRRATVRFRGNQMDETVPKYWEMVETIARESKNTNRKVKLQYHVSTGRWHCPTPERFLRGLRNKVTSILTWTSQNTDEATDVMARDSTYAVVTFTSRQAATAARKCLADGRGAESFTAVQKLPVPPLADSAAFNICDFRGCTKPVTIGLNQQQKTWRKILANVMVAAVCVFWVIPITWISNFGTDIAYSIVPKNSGLEESTVRGFVEAILLSLFLSVLPELFQWIANFGSNAMSLMESENRALTWFWYFMALFAIIGSSIAQMTIDAIDNASFNLSETMTTIARTIPVEVSYKWGSWTITKATIFLPATYLLQAHVFALDLFQIKFLVRVLRGGGAGARLPYRIYVESGTVLLCALALAPAAPIIAPFSVLYFLLCAPMLRYAVIFIYKPEYDSGGARWPKLFDMVMFSMLIGQLLLSVMVFFKKAIVPGVLAALPLIKIWSFRKMIRSRFLPAYKDAALLQSSMLDGWDMGPDSDMMTSQDREEFRRFLVDGHKASYVPCCVAAVNAHNVITAEPAVVLPMNAEEMTDLLQEEKQMRSNDSMDETAGSHVTAADIANMRSRFRDGHNQFGALNRRNLGLHYAPTMGSAVSPRASDEVFDHPRSARPAVAVSTLGKIVTREDGEIEYLFTSSTLEEGGEDETNYEEEGRSELDKDK